MTSQRDACEAGWLLAFACAKLAAGTGNADAVRIAAAAVTDWDVGFEIVHRHRLLPWLERASQRGDLPAVALHRLRVLCTAAAVKALEQVHALARLCALLTDAGIPVLPYKGPLLSQQLYGDVGLRNSTDIDLVVRRCDYDRARRILIDAGFPARDGHSARQESAVFASIGHASFGTDATVMVELHWTLARRQFSFALTPELAIERAIPSRIGGVGVIRMGDDDLLVTLAMHGTRHLFERLEWLAGFARLFASVAPRATHLIAHADSVRARRMLLVSVACASDMLAMPLPTDWSEAIAADALCGELARRLARDLRAGTVQSRPLPTGATLQWLYARMTDRRVDRVLLLARAFMLPTVREWEAVPLPGALSPLYRVIRPARLLAKYARRAFLWNRA